MQVRKWCFENGDDIHVYMILGKTGDHKLSPRAGKGGFYRSSATSYPHAVGELYAGVESDLQAY
jgi:hypothetical protein